MRHDWLIASFLETDANNSDDPQPPYGFTDLTDDDRAHDDIILALAGDDPQKYWNLSDNWPLARVYELSLLISARHYYDNYGDDYGE